jgi:hypothetical protein
VEEDKRIKNFLETTISCLKGSNDGYVKVYKYNLEILENILNELERLKTENTNTSRELLHRTDELNKLIEENEQLEKDLKYVLDQTLGAFENNWCIDWNFTDIREKYNLEEE